MKTNLGIVICENFIEEIEFAVKTYNIKNVMIIPFTSTCSKATNKKNHCLIEAINLCEKMCNKIFVIIENNCCSSNLEDFINNKEKCTLYKMEHCLNLFINKDVVNNLLDTNSYVITSGWLKNMDKDNTSFILDKKPNKLLLLDTGIYEDSTKEIQILANNLNLPYDSFFVGLDFFHMFIEKIMLDWKLELKNKKKISNIKILREEKYKKLKDTYKLIEKKKGQLLYILDSIYEGVFILDTNYKILFVNKGVEKLLNINNFKSILGRDLFEIGIVHKDYRDIILNRFEKVLKHNISVPIIEEKMIQFDGNIIPVNIYSGAIEYEGNPCILSVIRDISEHKKSENLRLKIQEQSRLLDKAAEYDKLKTEFFANLSHEFRTPLNVMLSTLQLLNLIGANKTNTDSKDKISKYYNIMKQNCYRLLRLVNNLIDITKIDAEYFKLSLKNENIISTIEDITLSVTDYAKNKGLDIIFDTNVEEKLMACDADKIERIMLNLLSNAIKFTSSGGSIFVNILDKDSSIIVSVRDTGVGIPKDKQLSIFKRFVQVDKSLSRKREGSGIGLSLVKSLVELHNGTIKINSEYGKGSEFIIELPVKVLPESENVTSDEDLAKESNIQRIKIEFSDIYD
ncbi:sensor histidine kinase [Clostridium beijerinckii]|jgi:PAS domain S-box|uniref:histidine kinase n=2 Tax=Clostridium beijerinckii TaxID=1520 RepID=A0AAE2RW01_CLOBE|nr:PAS domain-containing sensor histidine kinase [Clostridium beijerinckii]ABR34593.1 PAS/PAC sensor signal transduction histidine kinase [Clostridium beijerinckii NCIMB 8052]AIU04467.1 PAS/PAC sensor signal transduction histidine kinase [Clostridium beijerinckii ATCC 35702]MBF7810779.1 PAS domain S-box protein [Clostridium beijerinckii]NRT24065.1 PAS domain S-box-containing protein [Clostridium beijerinckii]NRT68351.1 PAS domain S-box-containing protein [Clostridium beijerinckii]